MSGPTDELLDVGIRVPARLWPGPEGVTFLVVAGLGCSARDFDDVAAVLAARGQVLVLEVVGRTAASTGAPGHSLALDQSLLRRVVRCRAPGRVVLVGHSMGAFVALRAAAADPGRFAGLILSSSFFPIGRNGRSAAATAADYGRHRLLFAAGAFERRRRRGGAVRAPLLTPVRAIAPFGLRPKGFHRIADGVTCPVLVVHGACDHYVPAAFALAAAARHPSWQLELIRGSGHFPHRDSPDAWYRAADAWLRGLPWWPRDS